MTDELVRTSYELRQSQAEKLKQIAGDLGFVQSRGPGAGELPNVSALLRALGDVDRAALVAALRKLGVGESQSV